MHSELLTDLVELMQTDLSGPRVLHSVTGHSRLLGQILVGQLTVKKNLVKTKKLSMSL